MKAKIKPGTPIFHDHFFLRWLCIGCHVAHHQKEQTV